MPINLNPLKVFLLFIVVFLAASGLVLFGTSYLPFELVKPKIDAFDSVDGNASAFTPELFQKIIVKFRILSLLLILTSILLYIGLQQAQRYISSILVPVLISFITFFRELVQRFYIAVRKEDKIHFFGLFIILLLSVSIRLYFLFQPMRYDEATTFLASASKPLFIGLSHYPTPNNHLFHTFLVHLAYLILGSQPWVIRLPALLAGILLVPASYLLTRVFYNKYAALLAAGFVASSSVLIDFSTNARGYTLICLIFLIILALGAYLLRNRSLAIWVLFATLSALGFYTIPIMLYPFGIVIIWLILSIILQDTNIHRVLLLKDLFISLTVAACLTLILYLPVFTISGIQSVVGNQFLFEGHRFFLSEFPHSVYSVWNTWNRDIPTVVKFLLVSGFFTSVIFHKRLTSYRVPIILAAVIWLIPLITAQRVVPHERVWLFLLPLYIILASSGVAYLPSLVDPKMNRYGSIVFTSLAITLSCWLSWNIYRQPIHYSLEAEIYEDAEPISIFLKDYLKPGDKVLIDGPPPHGTKLGHYPFEYYFYLHHVPAEYLRSDLNSSSRILLIANASNDEILKGILDEAGMLSAKLSVPRIVKRYKSATVYEINRDE